ncbi:AAA family ATPase [Aeromonas veronii]|nr:AAA family ATPase [Aeromonas veronii]
MFTINKLSSDILVRENDHHYGFNFEFKNGLNIITGQNSSGKSSVLSCIYYNLGMEQLLGMGTSKSSLLDKCLTSEFTYKGVTYTITQSIINLEIINDNGDTALLQRMAFSQNIEDRNHISITMDGNTSKYFLHSTNDHSDKRGFYTWLQLFIGIDLPKEENSLKHTLYLQNVFSSCFIEQTKGWSDFMSQMPSFNIKDAKRKLVEYLLSLDCLDNDIEKDRLRNKRESIIEKWDRAMHDFFRVERSLNYIPDGLANKYEKSPIGYFDKLKLKVTIESEWLDIAVATNKVRKELELLRNSNRMHEKQKDATNINENRKHIKRKLLKLNRIISSLDRAYTSEKEKISLYTEHLSILKEEKSGLVGARKVDDIFNHLSDSETCPLCESSISLTTLGKNVSKTDYENSLHFIDSKISMISGYLE